MTRKKSFFHKINENQKERVKCGDGSTIPYAGKGNVPVTFKTSEVLMIPNVLYLPDLKINILSPGKLDDQGCKTILSTGFLTIHYKLGRLLTKMTKTSGNMYKVRININKNFNLIEGEASQVWLLITCIFNLNSYHI